jgi:glucan phosphoethanolaminetransferase (alkaline phosphatase superfamily)
MRTESLQRSSKSDGLSSVRRLYDFLARRGFSVIMFGALLTTLMVKFFHSYRCGLVSEYLGWIPADIAVLLAIEVVLAIVCFRWPSSAVIRTATIIATVVYIWSMINAGWLIRTGTQILPSVFLPVFRDPINACRMVGVNLAKMPLAAVILLAPSAVALTFFFSILARPQRPDYNPRFLTARIVGSLLIIAAAFWARNATIPQHHSSQMASEELRYNSQLMAVTSFLLPDSYNLTRADLANAHRIIPSFDEFKIPVPPAANRTNHNIVILVLEGIQYRYTSLSNNTSDNLTPYLAKLAKQGVEFTNARSTLTHTTKALFSLLTGRFPSASHDLAEAVPAPKPYASLATILKSQMNFRTAFFQSAKGDFESRPSLVYNLGFDKFWSRENLNDPNAFLGYLASDEFSMLKPITDWITADERPFLLTILCSVSHDPYEVPRWFAQPASEPLACYRQAVFYTDRFIAALDAELARLNLTDKTIFCVIADHGEAFGEHGGFGHERIAFDEALQIPFCLRAPALVEPATKVTQPVSSIDLTPTLLALLGLQTQAADFDGLNALGPIPADRKIYFSCWLNQGHAGFIENSRKFIYDPSSEMVFAYDLDTDPFELSAMELPPEQAHRLMEQIVTWRKNSIFRLQQPHTGKRMLFGNWLCRWSNRVSSAKLTSDAKNQQ